MQTFLPYKDFDMSAQALDNKRLNKQILEGYQILKVLSSNDPFAAWRNHPAVKMWRGSETWLWNYVMSMVAQADERGIKTDKNMENLLALQKSEGSHWGLNEPKWYSDVVAMDRLTTSHKANLYNKDSMYYFDFYKFVAESNPCCPERKVPCKYYWVTHDPQFKETHEELFQMAS